MMLQLLFKKHRALFFLQRCRWFSSSAIDANSSLTVMSFGDGSQGALGLSSYLVGIQDDAYEPTDVPNIPSNVSSVCAGHYHSLAVTSQGELWAWGRNNEGQLGRDLHAPRESWHEPKRVEKIGNIRVRAAFASGVVSAAVDDEGYLWIWGRSKRGQLGLGKEIIEVTAPVKVKELAGENISKVSFGWGHALALTVDGKLYGWGYSADGRLGQLGKVSSALDSVPDIIKNADRESVDFLDIADRIVQEGLQKEDRMPIIWKPHLIEELESVEVIDIACGLDHSLVLCSDGTLLSGGSNAYGQLGRPRGDLSFRPVNMPLDPLSISSGLGHSMALCKASSSTPETEGHDITRKVVSWGWNRNSQLGRKGQENQLMVIDGLEGQNPTSLSAGRAHSLALTDKGELWVWGCGRNGRLGLGSSVDEPEPIPIDLGCCRVVQAVAGFDHSLILLSDS